MNGFVDMATVGAATPLKSAFFPFARGKDLQKAVGDCITDYYIKVMTGAKFEARGVLVTGRSRVGKSREIEHLIGKLNASDTLMPDGRAAKFISFKLPGRISWKEVGAKTLEKLGYPASGHRTASYHWDMVRRQAQQKGVIGIHIDEAQHLFSDTGTAGNRVMLDDLKSIQKESDWPLITILSGVPALRAHVETGHESDDRDQLKHLLSMVHFEMIRPDVSEDINELNMLAYTYAEKAQINFDALSSIDFLRRLAFACSNRWGLVVEMIITALVICKVAGSSTASRNHFDQAFCKIHICEPGCTPFSVDDYENFFDQTDLLKRLRSG